MRLKDKVALITGSSSGVGACAAELFAREGAKVIINYNRTEEGAREVYNKIKGMGGEAIVVKADVAKREDVEAMVRRALDHFGRIDVLVNNAGVYSRIMNFLEFPEEEWDRMMQVNLKGVYYCCQAVAPIMLQQQYGSIINVASINNILGRGMNVAYGCAKMGQIVLTRFLARQLAPHVRVNCIGIGIIDTRMSADQPPEWRQKHLETIPMKRLGRPEEVAHVMLFLASDEASFITGQTIFVDGGQHTITP